MGHLGSIKVALGSSSQELRFTLDKFFILNSVLYGESSKS